MSTDSVVFQIRNLYCAYEAGEVVLHIPELDIPAGELIFVLGVSGIGKSTLIETLGMMNHTILDRPGTRIWFRAADGTESELSALWKEKNDRLSTFRNRYFSFIFQNNNLMPNFTAGENMAIGLLIRGDSLAGARPRILELMQELDLPADKFDMKVVELSGGQRQRLAFVRAVTSSFEVLFGDEPTGNLDRYTAQKLLNNLKSVLQQDHKTGIIVSHDIDLALQFADRILIMTARADTEQPGRFLGEILPENILRRQPDNRWLDDGNRAVEHPSAYLQNKIMASSKELINA